jgi:hypothetical protein
VTVCLICLAAESGADPSGLMSRALSLNAQGRARRQPFGRTHCSHMRKVCDVPKYDVLLLYTLIIFIIPELASSSEDPRNILARARLTNRHIVVGKSVPFTVILRGRITRAGQDQDSMSVQLIANKPGSVSRRAFYIVQFVRILAPAWAPAAICSSLVMDEHLIHAISVDIEIKSPVRVVHMVRVAGEPTALENRPEFAIFRQMPGLIDMIFANPGIDAEFQPLHVILSSAFDADFLIAAVHDRHEILPTQTILERATAPTLGTRPKPGKGIPPDHLF